jgi:hypothetical protein
MSVFPCSMYISGIVYPYTNNSFISTAIQSIAGYSIVHLHLYSGSSNITVVKSAAVSTTL